jgi:hypothetical protein
MAPRVVTLYYMDMRGKLHVAVYHGQGKSHPPQQVLGVQHQSPSNLLEKKYFLAPVLDLTQITRFSRWLSNHCIDCALYYLPFV